MAKIQVMVELPYSLVERLGKQGMMGITDKVVSFMLFLGFLALIIGGYLLYHSNKEVAELKEMVASLQGNQNEYSLPADVAARLKYLNNQLTEIQRQGPDSVYITRTYVPPEAELIYTVQQDTVAWNLLLELQDRLANTTDSIEVAKIQADIAALRMQLFITTVEFDNKGFCFKPFIGAGITSHADFAVNAGARLFYWNRWGAGLQGSVTIPEPEFGVGAFVGSRIPGLENTEGFVGGGYNFTRADWEVFGGVHIYLD